MNFSLYVLGTPNGYNQYPADNTTIVFQEFLQNKTTESQLTVKRSGQLVYYVYMRQLQEKPKEILGFCLVFNGVYCHNPKKLFALFDRAYFDVRLKGEFLRFDKVKVNYVVSKFVDKLPEIERVKDFFKRNIEQDFIRDFTNLPPAFKFGGGIKAISKNESDEDILATIAEYDIVHILNNEKSLSELERTQKMLTDLWAEKHALQQKFNILLAKKKQYDVVIILCCILISCGIGLFIFNKNLQSKDGQIIYLNQQLTQKQSEVKNLNNTISQLQTDNEALTNEKTTLQGKLTSTTKQLDSVIDNNKLRMSEIEATSSKYKNDIDKYKQYEPITYKAVYDAEYYFRYRCREYKRTDCYENSGKMLVIYKIAEGYGLTEYGWVEMSNLSKY